MRLLRKLPWSSFATGVLHLFASLPRTRARARIFPLRLEAEMQTLTLKQHVEKVDSELRTMTAWSQSKSEFDKRSSKLDIKYCQDRYAKGVVAVDRFMATKHKYIVTDDMAGGQVEIIRMAENLSSSRRRLLHGCDDVVSDLCSPGFDRPAKAAPDDLRCEHVARANLGTVTCLVHPAGRAVNGFC